jgi:peptide/nickel transport system permease protein
MMWFVARRLLAFVATVIVAAGLIYAVLSLAPVQAPRDTPSLLSFLAAVVTGGYGRSSSANADVGSLLWSPLSVTIPLALMGMVLAALVGGGIAWLAALRRGSLVDRILTGLIEIGIAVPNFWLGMLLILLFALTLHWFPPAGFMAWTQNFGGALLSLILPAFALGLPRAAVIAHIARTALRDMQDADYLRAARGRGLTEDQAVRRHGLRNAAVAAVRPIGIELATLIAGAVIVENVFYLPGLGTLLFNAVVAGDVNVVRGGTMVLVLLLSGTLFLFSLAEAWVDPRARDEEGLL